ncbi:MAG: type IV pilus twitching motility protein PilT [Planctomycetes bacterium]|nr:type IV pilus twitching motility protein PilT [Planctomycetota bacterium]
MLELAIEKKASDIHLAVGRAPTLRIDGRLRSIQSTPLTPDDTLNLMKSISSERNQQELNEGGGSDFAFAYGDKARFRVSVFRQRGSIGIVLRQIPRRLFTFEEIGLPNQVKNLLFQPRGLILITGPTGSGKTSTMATMIDFINAEADCHIITIEDPIEYYHQHKKSIITQREVGVDVSGWSEALRRALRQDPDVVLLGEMRDLETISIAVTAAETGHLVMGTLHTIGAAETVNRLIDAFPVQSQEQIRAQLSTCLLAVLSQALIPCAGVKGRVAAFELMIRTPAISHLIRENKAHRLTSEIQTGGKLGMTTLDDSLFKLFQEKTIKYADMMECAQDGEEMQRKVEAFTRSGAAAAG